MIEPRPMPDIPEEAWREARKQARIHGYNDEPNAVTFATGWALGRASIHAEWVQSLASDPGPDETGDLRMRADALARQRVGAKVRAEVLYEAAAFYDKRARELHDLRKSGTLPNLGQEWGAFDAAGRHETVADELRAMAESSPTNPKGTA